MDVTSYLLGKNSGGGSTPTLQEKEITITQNGTTSVTADEGYDGLSEVEVTTNVGGGYEDYIIDTPPQYATNTRALIKKLPIMDFKNVTTFVFSGSQFLESIEGIINTTSLNNQTGMFQSCYRLKEIPNFDCSNITNLSYAFQDCVSISTIPQLNTSNVTNMSQMFSCSMTEAQYGGGPLTYIPLLNTSKVTNMENMFYGRKYLNNNALDNILQMCINATSYNGTKTLSKLGIYSSYYYPVSNIEALPHYQDFINAGWTIGY